MGGKNREKKRKAPITWTTTSTTAFPEDNQIVIANTNCIPVMIVASTPCIEIGSGRRIVYIP